MAEFTLGIIRLEALDLNHSSDSSSFSEGAAKVTEWFSLFLQFVPDLQSKKAWEDVAN